MQFPPVLSLHRAADREPARTGHFDDIFSDFNSPDSRLRRRYVLLAPPKLELAGEWSAQVDALEVLIFSIRPAVRSAARLQMAAAALGDFFAKQAAARQQLPLPDPDQEAPHDRPARVPSRLPGSAGRCADRAEWAVPGPAVLAAAVHLEVAQRPARDSGGVLPGSARALSHLPLDLRSYKQ